MAAYRRAAAIGADAVECDVRMTRDGVLVCVHDRQIAHTSNGRGVVSALHLDELEQFHFGARKSQRAAGGPATRSPRCPTSRTSRTAWSSPSTGCSTTSPPPPARCGWRSRPSTRPGTPARSRRRSSARLERFGLLRDGAPVEWAGKPAVRMMSFSQLAVRRMADLAPGVPTVQLIGKRLRPVRRELLTGSATAVGPGISLLRSDPDYVADAHAAGKEVHVWTVNEARDMDLVRDLGVDVDRHRPSAPAAPPARARGVHRLTSRPRGILAA